MTMFMTGALLLTIVAFGGCSRRAADPPRAVGSTTAVPEPAVPTPAASHAAPAPGQSGQAVETVTGTVVETMDASNYTYVRVKTASGDVWAAASRFPVAVGDRVTVPLESPMENFHSPSLNRDFPLIYFASHIDKEGAAPPAPSPHGAPATAAATPAVTEAIAPPQGGLPIAQVWADRQKLAGRPVTVRGKVVKYNPGILGRNWVHIQDGSGKGETSDLTLTTADPTSLGAVITATGTVAIDQDFGAGYSYKVMLEKASIK